MKEAEMPRLVSGFAMLSLLWACSSTTEPPNGGTGGSQVATGGLPGTNGGSGGSSNSSGGTTNAAGGASTTAGGATSSAGTSNSTSGGSTSAVGGSTASGGSTSNGGATASGGATPGSGGSTVAGSGGAPTAGTGGAAPAEPKVVTSANGEFWKVGTLTEVTSGTADVTVNDGSKAQTWKGFGGTFNEVGWKVLSVLPEAERTRAVKLLFDKSEGANFAYGRIPIGASDYAISRYSLNETAGDVEMKSFSIDHDKAQLIPYIQAAIAVKPDISFWGSPWTPPTWMKTGAQNMGWDGGSMKEDATTFQALANYLAKFVEEYKKVGINVTGIHPQNEPGYETRYPSCLWTAGGMAQFIGEYLGPTFKAKNIGAEILLGTMSNNDAGKDGTIVSTVTGNSKAMEFVKGFGFQWNMLPVVASVKSRNLTIVQTEHKCGNYHWNPAGFPAFNADKPPNDYAYGVESWGYIRDWIKAGVHVYSAWNMVLDVAGKNLDTMRPWPQNALLVVDTNAKTLTATPAYWVFRHASQYVDPGASVVGTSGGDALAFKNPDGSIVAVIYNSGGAKQFTVSIGGKLQRFAMPANGFATVNL